MLRTFKVKLVISNKNFGFEDSFVVTKCFQQKEMPYLFPLSAPCTELPSSISTTPSNGNFQNDQLVDTPPPQEIRKIPVVLTPFTAGELK